MKLNFYEVGKDEPMLSFTVDAVPAK